MKSAKDEVTSIKFDFSYVAFFGALQLSNVLLRPTPALVDMSADEQKQISTPTIFIWPMKICVSKKEKRCVKNCFYCRANMWFLKLIFFDLQSQNRFQLLLLAEMSEFRILFYMNVVNPCIFVFTGKCISVIAPQIPLICVSLRRYCRYLRVKRHELV